MFDPLQRLKDPAMYTLKPDICYSGEAAVVVIVRLGIISDYIDYVKFALTLSDRYIAHWYIAFLLLKTKEQRMYRLTNLNPHEKGLR